MAYSIIPCDDCDGECIHYCNACELPCEHDAPCPRCKGYGEHPQREGGLLLAFLRMERTPIYRSARHAWQTIRMAS